VLSPAVCAVAAVPSGSQVNPTQTTIARAILVKHGGIFDGRRTKLLVPPRLALVTQNARVAQNDCVHDRLVLCIVRSEPGNTRASGDGIEPALIMQARRDRGAFLPPQWPVRSAAFSPPLRDRRRLRSRSPRLAWPGSKTRQRGSIVTKSQKNLPLAFFRSPFYRKSPARKPILGSGPHGLDIASRPGSAPAEQERRIDWTGPLADNDRAICCHPHRCWKALPSN
jgi:hypothetical protein